MNEQFLRHCQLYHPAAIMRWDVSLAWLNCRLFLHRLSGFFASFAILYYLSKGDIAQKIKDLAAQIVPQEASWATFPAASFGFMLRPCTIINGYYYVSHSDFRCVTSQAITSTRTTCPLDQSRFAQMHEKLFHVGLRNTLMDRDAC
jgi:hypothetical protein